MSSDESFYREVDDDYRREQIAAFIKKRGVYLAAAAFAIVASVAGYSAQRYYAAKAAETGGDRFVEALVKADEGQKPDAEKALRELASDASPAYATLARLSIAAEAVAGKNTDAAIAEYRGVAADSRTPDDLRDFARVQLGVIAVDKQSYEEVTALLAPYRSGKSQWRHTAKEALALSAMKAGKTQEAASLYQEIYSDGAAPQGMRQRAKDMIALTLETPKATARNDGANDTKTQ